MTVGAAQPLGFVYSRTIEHEADVFALELTHLNDAGARAFMKLGAQNLSNPDPPRVIEMLHYTHPALADRVRFALEHRDVESTPGQLASGCESGESGTDHGDGGTGVRHHGFGVSMEGWSRSADRRVDPRGRVSNPDRTGVGRRSA